MRYFLNKFIIIKNQLTTLPVIGDDPLLNQYIFNILTVFNIPEFNWDSLCVLWSILGCNFNTLSVLLEVPSATHIFHLFWVIPECYAHSEPVFREVAELNTPALYFSHITATSFSGGRSRSTRRDPPTTDKPLVNFITCAASRVHLFVIYKHGREPTPYWR